MKQIMLTGLLVCFLFSTQTFSQKKDNKPKNNNATTEQPNLVVKPKPPVKVTTVEGITEYRLDNGLRVLLFPDPSKPTITVNITYLVGSKHENYGETGMAHLLEHLVFKGTPRHPNIPQELTEHGASPNGTTWLDRTNYFETFAATEENLKWALDLEADRMVNSFIAKKDLDSEMSVVRNEFESGENDPFGVLMERMTSTAYLWHNYGKSTIGARSDIENVPIERLQAFYKKYYQPDNAVLTVAGKFDEAKTLEMINQYFGVIPKPTRELPVYYTKDPTQDGERFVTLKRVGDVQLAGVFYHTPPSSHADAAAVQVLGNILGGQPYGRLYKNLVDNKKANSVYAFTMAFREGGQLMGFAEVAKDKPLDEARNILLKSFDELATTNPPTAEEVERAKNDILKNLELSFNSSQTVALRLSEAIGAGDWRLLFISRDRLKKVNIDDVKRVATYYLKPDNRTVGVFIPTEKPDRVEIPDMPDVEALVKDYKGTETVKQGEEFDPSPANINARTKKSTLANGAKVALLSKKTRGEVVSFRMTLRFGDLQSLKNKSTAASYAARMLDKGTKNKTRQQIKDEFDKLKARVSIFGGATQASVNIETTRENLIPAINLLAEVLKEPSFPVDELDKMREEDISGIEQQRSEPQSIAINKISKYLSPYGKDDPRYAEDIDESLASVKAVTIDQVKQFYKDFYGASDATMTAVGDFDESEVRNVLEQHFGGWKSPKKFERLVSIYKDAPAINENIETPDKANAFFVAMMNLEVRDDDPDYPAMLLGNFMLGGGFLNSRLAVRIRQKEGISYGVGSSFSANPLDKTGSFVTYAIYAPENVERLEKAFKEEIDKAIKEGFTAEEVAAAKSGWLQSRQVGRSQDASLANTLNNNLYLNREITWDEELEKKVQALTPEQIKAAMQRFIKPEKISIIKAGDFKGAKEKAAKEKKD
ncbi:MAG: pitrilysin family protein [Thermoflexibacter sp.]